jgi:preprotein translocase subunit SecG
LCTHTIIIIIIVVVVVVVVVLVLGERGLTGGENIEGGHFEGRIGRLGK